MTFSSSEPLGRVAKIFNGKTPPRGDQRDVGHPVLKIIDVDESGLFRGKFGSFVDPAFAAGFAEKFAFKGDTLILNAAHNADYVGSKTFYVSHDVDGALATGEWLIIRPNNRLLDSKYANHWLRSSEARRSIRELVKGIHLYPKDVARLVIPLPPLDEQKRMAAILDQADELRRLRQRAIDRLNELGQAIFYEMFGNLVTNPMDWPTEKVANLCERITVGIVVKPASYYRSSGVPALRGTNIKPTGIDMSDVVYFSEADNQTRLSKTRIWEGDVVVVRSGRPGLAAVVPAELNGINSIDVLIATPHRLKITPRFLRDFINSVVGKRLVSSESRGQVQQHFNVGSLSDASIVVPPIEMQIDFEKALDLISAQALHFASSAKSNDALFSSLRHRAFQGQL